MQSEDAPHLPHSKATRLVLGVEVGYGSSNFRQHLFTAVASQADLAGRDRLHHAEDLLAVLLNGLRFDQLGRRLAVAMAELERPQER